MEELDHHDRTGGRAVDYFVDPFPELRAEYRKELERLSGQYSDRRGVQNRLRFYREKRKLQRRYFGTSGVIAKW